MTTASTQARPPWTKCWPRDVSPTSFISIPAATTGSTLRSICQNRWHLSHAPTRRQAVTALQGDLYFLSSVPTPEGAATEPNRLHAVEFRRRLHRRAILRGRLSLILFPLELDQRPSCRTAPNQARSQLNKK